MIKLKAAILKHIEDARKMYKKSNVYWFLFNETGIACDNMNFVTVKDNPDEFFNGFYKFFEKEKLCFDFVLMMVHKSQMINFIVLFEEYLTDKQLGMCIRKAWIESEFPNVYERNSDWFDYSEYFSRVDKKYVMTKKEMEKYENLPNTIICYRGVFSDEFKCGMSFSLDIDMAKWFSKRFSKQDSSGMIFLSINGIKLDDKIQYDPKVYKLTVNKEDILAYFEREDEVVVDKKHIVSMAEL